MSTSCPKCGSGNTEGSKFCRECAAPLPVASPLDITLPITPNDVPPAQAPGAPSRDFPPGTTFAGRFRIIEALGGGGMGRVYKALDTKVGEKVALKLIRPEIAASPGGLARFNDELRLARRIAHPNVCRMFDLGEEAGAPYISMEYVAGETLESVVRMTKGLSPGQTAGIGKQIAAGLAEAHRLGVIHRDLKPQNIMIDRDGTARIMDFGIARAARVQTSRTGQGAMIGTPDYMSPEQAEGGEVGPRADLYSLGVMLFEMATGRLPFEASTPLAMALKHKTQPPPDPASFNPRIPDTLARLILRLMEKDPANRPASATEVREELEGIEKEVPATTPVVARRATSTSRKIATRFPPRKVMIPAAAVVLLAAAVLLVTRLLPRRGGSAAPKTPDSIVVVGFENNTGDPKFEHLRKAIPELIITNLENLGRFQVTTWERMQDVLKQAGYGMVETIGNEAGFEICRREGVAAIVTGSFTKAGDTFAVNVKLLDAETRKILKSASSRGQGENSILKTQIDELSTEIARGLAAPGAAAPPEKPAVPVVDATTGSMEAYALFLKGRDHLSRIEIVPGVETLRRAVAIDPGFAIAHLWLGKGLSSIGDAKGAAEQFRLARANAAKATEKERLLIEASLARQLDRDEALGIRLFYAFVKAYPREKGAWSELGQVLQRAGRLDEAAAALRKATDLDPSFGEALNALAYNAMDRASYDEADGILRNYLRIHPEDVNPVDSLAELDYVRGRAADAESGYRRVIAADPGFGAQPKLAWMQVLQEKYVEALETLLAWRSAPGSTELSKAGCLFTESVVLHLAGRDRESRAALRDGRTLAASVNVTAAADLIEGWFEVDAGRWEQAREAFRRMASSFASAPNQQSLLSADPATQEGLALVAGGQADAAQALWARADASLRAREVSVFPVMVEMNDLLHARILAVRGDLDGARSLLARERPFRAYLYQIFFMTAQSLPLERDDLARILVRQGRRDEAIAQYLMLTGAGPGRGNRNPIPPIYHYRLAKLYDEAGRPADAAAEFGRFLKVLEKADARSKEMTDAGERLAAGKGSRP